MKIARILISSIIFIIFIFFFLDIKIISPFFYHYLTYFQFTPSLINFLLGGVSFALFGFLFIILITFIFGRIYCSSLCPLGTLQDIIIYFFKKRYHYQKPNYLIRYFILIITIVFVGFGSMMMINLLDPFSNFGRISVNIIKPVFLFIYNNIISLLEKVEIYILPQLLLHKITFITFIPVFLFFSFLIILCIIHGRIYCNLFCPVGICLGFISKYALFKIRINEKQCNQCGLCERVCKAGCINSKEKLIEYEKCINCYNCLDTCPQNGFEYSWLKNKKTSVHQSKREFLFFLGSIITAFFLPLKLFSQQVGQFIKINKKNPITPPGSLNQKHFTQNCIACYSCVSACPTRVIVPALFQYGSSNILQPTLDYTNRFCQYDCTICSHVCPTEAIQPITEVTKKQTQVGYVNLIKQNCIVYAKNLDCGACAEHCPTTAVYMVPYKNLRAPETRPKICIGCGACESICPARPYKAIYVEGNSIHQVAAKPERKQIQRRKRNEFPF